MPEFRQDPLSGQWVSIARERSDRPVQLENAPPGEAVRGCPFCEGNEHETPHEILAIRAPGTSPDGPGWRVRVVPNKYPFLQPANHPLAASPSDELFRSRFADGLHEVIIESPRHVSRVTQISDNELADVLRIYRRRLKQLQTEGRWRYALIFKNSGAEAGASLAHLHSQLVALQHVPRRVEEELARSARHFAQHGTTIWSELIRRECAGRERLVDETDQLVALCPFASHSPFQVLVLPKKPAAHFADLADATAGELAALLRAIIGRLETIFDPLAFNWMIHTSPFDSTAAEHYHWHVEIVPRMTKTAGYEWATGYAVNAVPPEEAAQRLRNSIEH